MQSLSKQVLERIRGFGKGSAFSSKDFVDLADRNTVDQILSRLCSRGVIRRITSGIYDFPRENSELGGRLSPDIQQVARALARKNGIRIQPSPAAAANLLGLSAQVPAKVEYLTDARTRTISVAGRDLKLKRVPPRELQPGSDIGVLVTQALRYIGRQKVGSAEVEHLKRTLSDKDKKRLRRDARYMEDWIWETIEQITGDVKEKKSHHG